LPVNFSPLKLKRHGDFIFRRKFRVPKNFKKMIRNNNKQTVDTDTSFKRDAGVSKHLYSIIAAVIISVFLILAVGSSLTTRPESDEGEFASPALNLVTEGHFGTTIFEKDKLSLTRIEQRTYWVMPLFLLNAAASFKAFGFSLFAFRLVSIFWGLVLISAWYFIFLKFSGNRLNSLLCLALVACNYVVLATASIGRGDTMCAALGFAAFAVYLWMRERNLWLAILLSQILVTAAGLTHPNGIMAFFGLLFLTLYFDFRSIGWRHVAIASLPYIIGGSAFGWWVWQDPEAFKHQFIDNALMGGRMEGFSSPFSGFIKEFTVRYPRAFGLLESSPGHSGPIYLKSLILVGYAIGLLGVIFTKELRRDRNFRPLLILAAIYFVVMSLLDGQKLAVYLIYIVPFYSALLSIWLYHMWEKRRIPLPLLILGVSGFILLQTGGIALRIKQNTYGNYYLPAVEYLNQTAADDELIMGSAELRFALKPSANTIADGRFAFYTGKRPEYIVYDPGIEDSWKDSKIFFPEFYEYFPRLLKEEYRIAYENTAFKVYVRR